MEGSDTMTDTPCSVKGAKYRAHHQVRLAMGLADGAQQLEASVRFEMPHTGQCGSSGTWHGCGAASAAGGLRYAKRALMPLPPQRQSASAIKCRERVGEKTDSPEAESIETCMRCRSRRSSSPPMASACLCDISTESICATRSPPNQDNTLSRKVLPTSIIVTAYGEGATSSQSDNES